MYERMYMIMKHTKKLLSMLMASLFLLTSVAACNMVACSRRDQYRDPSVSGTDTETADDPSGTGTTAETKPNGDNTFVSPVSKGNPYQGMSAQDLLTLYNETSPFSTISSDPVMNTPYYYLFSNYGSGGTAYSKLTGKFITLCKEPGCGHNTYDCKFNGSIDECFLIGDRMYLGITNYHSDKFRLYSFNLMLDDVKLIREWEGACFAPGGFFAYDGKIYTIEEILTSDDARRFTLYLLDPEGKSYTPVWGDDFIISGGKYLGGDCFYYPTMDGALWQYNLKDDTHTCLLDASLLDRENGDARFYPYCLAGSSYLSIMRQNIQKTTILYYDLNTGEWFPEESICPSETMLLRGWTAEGQYIFLKHNTPAYENDPHYAYYNTKIENWLENSSGGEIWFRKNSDDELSLFVSMKTDGIPDAISFINAIDSKTMVVKYYTYKDFVNVYNDHAKDNVSERYAIIDLETGVVYKP